MKAELEKKDQELAAEKAKSLENSIEYSSQIELLLSHYCSLTNRTNAVLASHATLQAAYRDLTSELGAHKGALELTREELKESRKEANIFYKAILKQDEDYKLVKEQLKEA